MPTIDPEDIAFEDRMAMPSDPNEYIHAEPWLPVGYRIWDDDRDEEVSDEIQLHDH